MLKEIFNSITPENIKNIPLLKDAMEIFIETIEEKCSISQDVKNVFDPENRAFREEFIKIYLDDMHRYMEKAKTDQNILNKINHVNELYGQEVIKRDFIDDLVIMFNDEHFVTSKAFKQKKGTKVGIEYIYNVVESLLDPESGGSSDSFVFKEKEPFDFQVEGSIPKEIYDGIVKPLAHPLGFTYVYLQIIKLVLHDYYQLQYSYVNSVVEVRCLNGNVEAFTQTITDVFETYEGARRLTRVTFDDGTYLEQYTNPILVTYFNADGTTNKVYSGHCSLYLSYDLVVELLTTDDFALRDEQHADDDYWTDYTNPAYIGSLVIGAFTVGGYVKYFMPDELTTLQAQNTDVPTEVGVLVDYLGFQIGSSFIGGDRIGGDYVYYTAPSEDTYDPRANVDETFEIQSY